MFVKIGNVTKGGSTGSADTVEGVKNEFVKPQPRSAHRWFWSDLPRALRVKFSCRFCLSLRLENINRYAQATAYLRLENINRYAQATAYLRLENINRYATPMVRAVARFAGRRLENINRYAQVTAYLRLENINRYAQATLYLRLENRN